EAPTRVRASIAAQGHARFVYRDPETIHDNEPVEAAELGPAQASPRFFATLVLQDTLRVVDTSKDVELIKCQDYEQRTGKRPRGSDSY
ncbi:hypothetical protein HAX54_046425, partial [Datura stramonium]|nr:hypothetical protein [Datura stramonium]